jgi:hypothetical protein
MRLTAAIVLTLALAACATAAPPPEPRIITKEVKVEVPVSCVPKDTPPAPTFSDTAAALKAAPGAEDRYLLLSGNWFPRDVRLALLESIVASCRKPPSPP